MVYRPNRVFEGALSSRDISMRQLENERSVRERAERQDELDRSRLAESHKKHGAALIIQTTVRAFLQRKAEDDARRAADKKKKKGGKKKK